MGCDLVNVEGNTAQGNANIHFLIMTFQPNPFYTGKKMAKGRGLFRGTQGDDLIQTNRRNNLIVADQGNDTIRAGAGDDVLFGGAGHDYLYGGIGDDVINGGYGNDRLNGGSGADRFFFNSGNSVVEDFNFGEGDSFTIGKNLTNVSFEQDGSDVLVKSDQGLTTILNNDINDFI